MAVTLSFYVSRYRFLCIQYGYLCIRYSCGEALSVGCFSLSGVFGLPHCIATIPVVGSRLACIQPQVIHLGGPILHVVPCVFSGGAGTPLLILAGKEAGVEDESLHDVH